MNPSRAVRTDLFVSRPITLLLSNCALNAIGTAWLVWSFFPYERLDRFSPAEKFLAWEGVVWLLGLAFAFLGLASVLQVAGLRLREGARELERRLRVAGSEGWLLAITALLPWWMLGFGIFLILVASGARALVAP